MKARRKVRWLYGWTLVWLCLFFCQTAESQPFSEGKNLFQLQESLHNLAASSFLKGSTFQIPSTNECQLAELPSLVFLPRWSAEELPFFCRIEHDFAKKNALPVKFRLGSVEYVDWLEGKNSSFGY